MSDPTLLPAAGASAPEPGLSQLQRVTGVFSSPSRVFKDIAAGHRSWWLPFLIVLLTGAFMYGAITQEVTWRGVYENQQRNAPAFAQRMMQNMPAEQRAAADRRGPTTQAVIWALSPLGLLLLNMIAALILWPTINFGFGGKANYGAILAVTMYATLVLWPIKLLLGGIALFAGALPDAFNLQNIAGTNIAYYFSKQDIGSALYAILMYLDPLIIWNLVVTSIGVSIVAGTKRGSGYIAVFGWWILLVLIGVGFAAAFS
ncbi:MAG TPA: YIP1 family protein [Terracidiphilus sp.]|nr:YIP1 family protein [Terracidiphilus sp.]